MGRVSRVILGLVLVLTVASMGGCSKIIWTIWDASEETTKKEETEGPPPPPQILFIHPGSYPTAGNDTMSLQGFDYQDGAMIYVDGIACTNIVFDSSIKIMGDVPSHALGTATVRIVNPDGQWAEAVDAIMYTDGPIIRALAPSAGTEAGGTTVIISGFNFQAGATVDFGTQAATSVVVVSATTISCVTPAAPLGGVPVTVTNPDTQFYTYSYYTYTPAAPQIASINPLIGTNMGGTVVTITGAYFQNTPRVLFGTIQSQTVTFIDANTITAATPSGPHVVGAVDVVVINPDQQRDTFLSFTYVYTNPAPTVTSVVPNTGPTMGGTPVVITGTGFLGGAVVRFGNYNPNSTLIVSMTQINCTTGPAMGITQATAVNVTVTNPDTQFGVLPNGFTYVPPAGARVSSYTIDPSANVDLWYFDFQANLIRFRAVMVTAGLHTGGSDPLTDVYVEDWLQGEILGYQSQFYLRNFNGTKISATSYNICFVGLQPGSPWVAPPPNQGPAQAWQYNIMSFYDNDPNASGALGRAGLDFTSNTSGMPINGRRENNSFVNGLGIFMAPIWNNLVNWGRVSVLTPSLNSTDRSFVDGSYVLGSGTAAQDTRFTAIRDTIRGFADGLATVSMHECGHSVGLVITARNNGNHCTNVCPLRAVASWGTTAWCTGTNSCAAELANSLGFSP